MTFFGSELHLISFTLIFLELIIFIFKLSFYLSRPDEYNRLWYLILLLLLIIYNIASGLYPDPTIGPALILQNILKYGSGFLAGSYFPLYFYKTYNLNRLRFHAFYGAPLCVLLPYIIFFLLIYPVYKDFEFTINYGFIIPFVYGSVLLLVIPQAITRAYQKNGDREEYLKAMAVFAGLSPWYALIILDYCHANPIVEILLANLGIIVITTILLWKSIKQMRQEHLREKEPAIIIISPELFQANCLHYGLTRTEILLTQKVAKGMTTDEIAEAMNISKDTVKKHIQNTFRKTGVNSRTGLIHQLQRQH